MSKIRMGVIGVGGIANRHIGEIIESSDAELAAICDVNRENLDAKGDLYNIPAHLRFESHDELLKCPDVDAVSICTPNNSHYPIAMDAIRYKKPFALEKPVALTYNEAKDIEEAALKNGIPNMVCFSYRFKSAARFARQIIREGHLGKIHHIYGQYIQSWGAKESLPLVWRFQKDFSGSGALGDLGSHMLDLVRFMFGDFVKVCGNAGTLVKERKIPGSEISGIVDVDDYCHFMAELDNGVSGSFMISRFGFGRGNYQRIEVYGSKGGLVYSLEDEDSIEVCIGELYGNARDYHRIPVPPQHNSRQMQSFFDIINNKGDGLAASISDGSINQRLLDSIIESFNEGKWVYVKD